MYEVAFEIEKSGIGVLWFPLIGLVMACVGFALLGHIKKQSGVVGLERIFVGAFRIFFVSFSLLWAVVAYIGLGPSQTKLRKSYEEGRFKVVEGTVDKFESDSRIDKFSVNNVVFEYNYYEVSPGFKHTAHHGGPIKEGLQVKITYIDELIVKLEVPLRANK